MAAQNNGGPRPWPPAGLCSTCTSPTPLFREREGLQSALPLRKCVLTNKVAGWRPGRPRPAPPVGLAEEVNYGVSFGPFCTQVFVLLWPCGPQKVLSCTFGVGVIYLQGTSTQCYKV